MILEQLEILKALIDPNQDTTRILDFGCGTGKVSQYLADYARTIMAIDSSKGMLEKFVNDKDNITILHGSLCHKEPEGLKNAKFDVVIARMVFHHLENKIKYMRRARELLKQYGMLIIQENGISSNPLVNTWFHETMRQKEERYFLSEEQLIFDMYATGFDSVQTFRHISRDFSIMNWLRNSETDENKIQYLYSMHINMPKEIKQVYNYRDIGNDILIDTEILWVMGYKC